MNPIENSNIAEKKIPQKESETCVSAFEVKPTSAMHIEVPKAKLKKRRRRLPAW